MPDPVKKTGDSDPGNKGAEDKGQITVKIGEESKTLKAEEVVNMLNQQAGVTQESQKVAAIRDAASKYGMDAEGYVEQAEGSFGTLTKLFDAGVIDKEGNILKPDGDKGILPDPDPNKDGDHKPDPANANIEAIVDAVSKRMEKTLEVLTKGQEGLSKNVQNTMKLGLKREVMAKHPELNEADVLNVLDSAQANTKKTLWDHAKDAVSAKATKTEEMDKHYAEKYGVNLEEFNKRNALKEQGADGGGAAAVVVNKKISFKAKRGDDKVVTPKQATIEFMKNLGK